MTIPIQSSLAALMKTVRNAAGKSSKDCYNPLGVSRGNLSLNKSIPMKANMSISVIISSIRLKKDGTDLRVTLAIFTANLLYLITL